MPVSLCPYLEQATPSSSKGPLIASYLELSRAGSSPEALSGAINQLSLLDISATYKILGGILFCCIGDDDVAPVLIYFALFHAVQVRSPQSL